MSARDDQPATVPPPAGEDDAYSATTKVGAMPADIMEKLRAEGLLPEDNERPTAVPVQRPSTVLEKRPTPPPPASGEPVPQLFSVAPPPAELPKATVTGPPPAPESNETPVAFTKPSSLPPPKLPRDDDGEDDEDSSVQRQETTGLTRHKAAVIEPVAKPPSRTTLYIVAAVVVVLLIVALLRLSR